MSGERTFSESEVYQLVGYLSAELEVLHPVTAPELIEALKRAMDAVQPPKLDRGGQLSRGQHAARYPGRS